MWGQKIGLDIKEWLVHWCRYVTNWPHPSLISYWISAMTPVGDLWNCALWVQDLKDLKSGGEVTRVGAVNSSDSYPCSHWQASPPAVFLFMFLTLCQIKSITHLFAFFSFSSLSYISSHRNTYKCKDTYTHVRTTHTQRLEMSDVIGASSQPITEPSGLLLQ